MLGEWVEGGVEGGVEGVDEDGWGSEYSGEKGRSGKRALERVEVEDSDMVVDT